MNTNLEKRFEKVFFFLITISPFVLILGLIDFRFHSYFWPFINISKLLGRTSIFDYVSVLDLYLLGMIGLYIVKSFIEKSNKKIGNVIPLIIPIILIFVGIFAARVNWDPVNPVIKSFWIQVVTNFISPILFFLLILFSQPNKKIIDSLVRNLFIAFSFLGFISIFEYFTNLLPGANKDFLGRLVWPYVDPINILKPESANWLAFLFGPISIFSFVCAILKDSQKKLAILTFVLSFGVLLLTRSYTGIAIASAIIGVFAIMQVPQKYKKIAVITFIALIIIGIASQFSTRKFQILLGNYKKENSIERREQIYLFTWRAFQKQPFAGIGPANYQSYFRKNMNEYINTTIPDEEIPPHTHNFIALFWSELGLFGLLAALYLYAYVIFQVLKRNQLYFLPVAYFLGHGLLDAAYGLPEISVLFWLTFVLAIAMKQAKNSVAHL